MENIFYDSFNQLNTEMLENVIDNFILGFSVYIESSRIIICTKYCTRHTKNINGQVLPHASSLHFKRVIS